MNVYIDVIFLENLIINYIILYMTAVVSKVKQKYFRILMASSIGAIYSVMYYIINIRWFAIATIKIMLSVVIIYIAFGPKDFKIMIKEIIFFYLISFIFAGASLGIIYMVNYNKINIQNGVIVGNYTLKTILIGIIISFFIILIAFKIIKKKKSIFCNIKVFLYGNEIDTTAMIDTGNLLKEPITNIPVVVLEHTLLYDIMPKEILNNIEEILGGNFENVSDDIRNQYIAKLKVIPFSSLGKQNGLLLGVKADKIEINYEEDITIIDKVIVGIYDKSLTKRGEYRALIGGDLIK